MEWGSDSVVRGAHLFGKLSKAWLERWGEDLFEKWRSLCFRRYVFTANRLVRAVFRFAQVAKE